MLYLYCYSGQYANDCYLAYGERWYESNWTILPVQQQKDYVLLISNAQQTISYHGFDMVKLNLETFLKVSVPWFFFQFYILSNKVHCFFYL